MIKRRQLALFATDADRRLPQRNGRSRREGVRPNGQRGVVLVIALIFLTVLFLLGSVSMRIAQSTEGIAGAVRTNELAIQAAEVALRHCEQSVVEVMRIARGDPPSYATTFGPQNILPRAQADAWQSATTWDSPTAAIYTVPLEMVNQAGLTYPTYRRPPECMVAPIALVPSGSTSLSDTASFVVTARGFGPEVSAVTPSAASRRPDGTEVWLQTHVTLE